jgi:hypothetical protein
MAQAVSAWPLTVEAHVRAPVSPCGICGGQSDTRQLFSEFFGFPSASYDSTIVNLSPHHEVCDSSDQASHYHTLGPK